MSELRVLFGERDSQKFCTKGFASFLKGLYSPNMADNRLQKYGLRIFFGGIDRRGLLKCVLCRGRNHPQAGTVSLKNAVGRWVMFCRPAQRTKALPERASGRHFHWAGILAGAGRHPRRGGIPVGPEPASGAAVAKRSPRAPSSGRHPCWGGISPETEALVGGNPSPAATSFPGVRAGGGIPVGRRRAGTVRFLPAVIRLPVFRKYEPFRRMPER